MTDIDVDPVQFRVPASDTRGHSDRMYFRCQQRHNQAVVSIVQLRVFPYRTKGDLLRHALVRHLHYLESIGSVPSVTAQVDAILEVLRDEEFASDFQLVFEKVGERVAHHLGSGAIGEARRLLLNVQRHLSYMPDGYWKDRYEKEIKDRWGHIVESAPKANLRKLEAGDD